MSNVVKYKQNYSRTNNSVAHSHEDQDVNHAAQEERQVHQGNTHVKHESAEKMRGMPNFPRFFNHLLFAMPLQYINANGLLKNSA